MPRLIVSLTTFPKAAPYAVGAVRSIMEGRLLPDKVVLYITNAQFEEEKTPIPQELVDLAATSSIFEIRDYPRDIRSYRKLVPALADFPDDIIVTIDDDVAYAPTMLQELMQLHSRYPKAIIAHRAKRIRPSLPYRKWPKYRWYDFLLRRYRPGFLNLQTGVGGVLYPPHSLRHDMLAVELFTRLAPTADDIWFWAAATAAGTQVLPVPFGQNKPKGLGKPKELSLKTDNFKSKTDLNRRYFDAILATYPEIAARINFNSSLLGS